ncbi:hypothetical protein SAMN06265795_11971 [Noviherbaspirillum humi]|uniref:Uncharacterized protein n=1 Tax=Noviherbaspirillum humi TaxID=1688639 RepID=A0A239L5U6_9BURK|nr:hypothetical protein [Noviherbaspirillum humi]SNT25680.1 hypothetical protein SAMN06265795_11971 [Noviherbaspirillum humi]
MSYTRIGNALIQKCNQCGRQNEWNDSECPGCHVKRRPWLMFAAGLLVTLFMFSAVASLA